MRATCCASFGPMPDKARAAPVTAIGVVDSRERCSASGAGERPHCPAGPRTR